MLLLRTAVAIVLLTSVAATEQAAAALHGTWTATAGARVLRGTWTAEPVRDTANTARGTWQLLNDANQILIDGSWAAQKTPRLWQGTWSARVRSGQVFSGTWQAAVKESEARSLGELLQQTLERQITGSWRSQGLAGNWWLRADGR
jgi:hypothetical protein